MKIPAILITATAALFLAACQNNENNQEAKQPENAMPELTQDPHSYARPAEARVKHLRWEAAVDFDQQRIVATAHWKIETGENAEEIVLDTYGLEIESVQADGREAGFQLKAFEKELGQALHIPITPETKEVSVRYRTTDQARALQFLDPEQTAGKRMPFLFTQSQAILARSWVPTQDSPGIRFTYEARVSVPDSMLALMSAENPQERNDSGVYHFEMPQPIPSYLLALAAGDLQFASISERTGVYAEPALLDSAAYEFADLEKMVQEAENLYGSYAWGQYDLLVLPPSFPFGGMENPRLTFATPTILAGDRSLVSLVAHELAHSWSGNLVTNATWDDFWLNEGFTVYFEHRIMEAVYGREYAEMLASLTRDGLLKAAAGMMEEVPEDTRLKLDLSGRNPDEGVTSIPYDKGYFFLRLIEETVGRDRFDRFLRDYFEQYKFKVMTTEAFVEHLNQNLLSEEEQELIGVNEWIYETGIPDNLPQVESDRFAKVDSARKKFLDEGELPDPKITEAWSTHEWLHFINGLPQEMARGQLEQLDIAYGLSQSGNSEILAAWFQPTLRSGYQPVYPKVEEFLIEVGRRKFLTPTYKALLESEQGEWARDIYAKARPNYHAVSRDTMDELLGKPVDKSS